MNQMYPKTVACWLKKIYDELHLHGCTWTSPGDRQLKFCHYASATIVLCKLNGKHRIRLRRGRLGSGSLNMWWLRRPNELAPASLSNRNKLNHTVQKINLISIGYLGQENSIIVMKPALPSSASKELSPVYGAGLLDRIQSLLHLFRNNFVQSLCFVHRRMNDVEKVAGKLCLQKASRYFLFSEREFRASSSTLSIRLLLRLSGHRHLFGLTAVVPIWGCHNMEEGAQ
jgi:hypothetical protein